MRHNHEIKHKNTTNKHWSFQSEVFIFGGGNDHDVPTPEVPDCREMESHVGNDHQILKQGEKRITCKVEDNGIEVINNVKKHYKWLFILTPRFTVHVVLPEEKSRESTARDIQYQETHFPVVRLDILLGREKNYQTGKEY